MDDVAYGATLALEVDDDEIVVGFGPGEAR